MPGVDSTTWTRSYANKNNKLNTGSNTGSYIVANEGAKPKKPDPDPPYVPPTDKNLSSYSGGSSGSSSGGSSNYYSDLFEEFKRLSAQSRDEAIQAIIKNLDAVKGTYQGQIQDVLDQYQNLVNQNEVKKERARRIIRENQANRGQLESGLGRQELLNMNLGYDNITSNLNSAKTKAVNDIYNLITQAEAEAETNKSNIHNNYANALLQYRLANM